MNFVNSVGKRSAHRTHGIHRSLGCVLFSHGTHGNHSKFRVRIVLPRNARNPQKFRVRIVLPRNARKPQKFRVRREENTESVVKILILSGGLRSPPDRIAFATQSDCVRHSIGLRSPLDQIAYAVRTDSVRRTMTKHELLGD